MDLGAVLELQLTDVVTTENQIENTREQSKHKLDKICGTTHDKNASIPKHMAQCDFWLLSRILLLIHADNFYVFVATAANWLFDF